MKTDGDAELIAYLAEHDADCPSCGYQLRLLTKAVCPECAHALTLEQLTSETEPNYQRRRGCAASAYICAVGIPLTLLCLFLLDRYIDAGDSVGSEALNAFVLKVIVASAIFGPGASALIIFLHARKSTKDDKQDSTID